MCATRKHAHSMFSINRNQGNPAESKVVKTKVDMGSRCTVWTQVSCVIMVPFLLQTIGVFTPFWLIEDGTLKGLFYQRMSNGSTHFEVLDQPALGLHITSFIFLLLCALSCCITAGLYGPDTDGYISNDEDSACFKTNCLWFYCNIGIYVISSMLMLSGCWKFGSRFPIRSIGVSFYLCLASFLLIWLMVFVFIFDQLCKRRKKDGVFTTLLQKIYEDAVD